MQAPAQAECRRSRGPPRPVRRPDGLQICRSPVTDERTCFAPPDREKGREHWRKSRERQGDASRGDGRSRPRRRGTQERQRDQGRARMETTAITENRVRDKKWVEEHLGLKEFGSEEVLKAGDGVLLSIGYERLVFGDHGPYVECCPSTILWASFPYYRFRPAALSYYDECLSAGSAEVLMYLQKRRVSDKPNPPPGFYSVSNNRPEGYADYRPGYCYIRAQDCWPDGDLNVAAVAKEAAWHPRPHFTPARIQGVDSGVWTLQVERPAPASPARGDRRDGRRGAADGRRKADKDKREPRTVRS